MYFEQFVLDDLGCASYLIGDSGVGECVVVDPQWDVTPYLSAAAKQGMRIRYVIETHNHADHISGHGKLAQLGTEVAVFEEAGVDYPHKPLKDGEVLEIGEVHLRVVHTPGHRPEHIAIEVIDTSRADAPWVVLTGDSLFVGDVARPDLAIEPREGAEQLYKSLHERLLKLEDGVEVYPAHVSGSLCGKAMSPKASSTIGFERRYNPPLTKRSEASFVQSVTSELPPQPPHFGQIVAKNRGPFLTEEMHVRPLGAEELERARHDGAVVLDARSPEAFGGGHIPGAINVDLRGGQFGTRATWVLPSDKPVVLVVDTAEDLKVALSRLAAVGQDNVSGYLVDGMRAWDASGRAIDSIEQIPIAALYESLQTGDKKLVMLDVRENSEWKEGHIPGAMNIPFHDLVGRFDDIPTYRRVATLCASGTRSSIAASILQAQGFDLLNVAGGMDAWEAAGYSLVRES